jgi:beta-phosphoglucomutase-like phosphatase (HAD superfamily)
VAPEHAVTLTHTAAGIAAGRAAGLAVIAVGCDGDGEHAVSSLGSLLPSRLR